ncbi:hypothetical protein IWQ60_008335 [Tieghemiomyces parasiticus]|uniref:Uncharacterized protein n=1 Tax=Tieghemiomyces parasiticus TaxID=78921 RepID=A0A9W8DSB6_9FUNG|nr:hypothetical protein IWQ60_008335 [Tieghemiomyces parasiticus]
MPTRSGADSGYTSDADEFYSACADVRSRPELNLDLRLVAKTRLVYESLLTPGSPADTCVGSSAFDPSFASYLGVRPSSPPAAVLAFTRRGLEPTDDPAHVSPIAPIPIPAYYRRLRGHLYQLSEHLSRTQYLVTYLEKDVTNQQRQQRRLYDPAYTAAAELILAKAATAATSWDSAVRAFTAPFTSPQTQIRLTRAGVALSNQWLGWLRWSRDVLPCAALIADIRSAQRLVVRLLSRVVARLWTRWMRSRAWWLRHLRSSAVLYSFLLSIYWHINHSELLAQLLQPLGLK